MLAKEFYKKNEVQLTLEQESIMRVLRNYRWLRLTIFLVTTIGVYSTFGNYFPFFTVILVSIVLFLIVLARYTDCKTALKIVQNKINLIINGKPNEISNNMIADNTTASNPESFTEKSL